MKVRYTTTYSAIFFCLLTATLATAAPIDAGIRHYSDALRQLQWVLVEMENLDSNEKEAEKLSAQIRQDVAEKFARHDIHPRITKESKDITSGNYLRIHVQKIMLERTVYLSSVEWVIKSGRNEALSMKTTVNPPKYTKVSNQIQTVRQKINYMLNELAREYFH